MAPGNPRSLVTPVARCEKPPRVKRAEPFVRVVDWASAWWGLSYNATSLQSYILGSFVWVPGTSLGPLLRLEPTGEWAGFVEGLYLQGCVGSGIVGT